MEPLGRFYTSTFVSNLLVSRFRQTSPGTVLELGVGSGSLLQAAYERWKNADYYAVDIDRERIGKTSSYFDFAIFQHIDGLSPSLPEKMNIKVGSIDVAICNPPYLRLEKSNDLELLLAEGGLQESKKLKRITSDVVFLAQNLQMLKLGGELGIILPDGIFTSREFYELRKDLLDNHKILGVIQLPDNIFKKTEARTHILLLEKAKGSDSTVPLYCSNRFGDLESTIYIKPDEALHRMDYSYYKWKYFHQPIKTTIKLEDLGVEIKRGRKTRKSLVQSGTNYFHTTSFPASPGQISVENSPEKNGINAEPGDILLARVGKRCIGKVAIVEAGNCVITDCVYRIRISSNFREIVWQSFISRAGQEWLQAHAHGVCSRCISKEDLLSFPVFINDWS